jgi:hypothetical protein
VPKPRTLRGVRSHTEREYPMTRRNKAWRVVAMVFTVVNLVGLGMAAAAGEGMHSAIHVVLTLVGAAVAWRLGRSEDRVDTGTAALADARLEQLQQSIDAIALEVERIGEAQRFHVKLQSEQRESTP